MPTATSSLHPATTPRRPRHFATEDEDCDIDVFLRSLGLHETQRQAAIESCNEHLVLTVDDLCMIASQGQDKLKELFPQLGIRARVQAWLDRRPSQVLQPVEPVLVTRRRVLRNNPTDTGREGIFEVYIKPMVGGTLYIKNVTCDTSVMDLKALVSEKSRNDMPVSSFDLVTDIAYRRMKELNRPLSYYGVLNKCTIHALFARRNE